MHPQSAEIGVGQCLQMVRTETECFAGNTFWAWSLAYLYSLKQLHNMFFTNPNPLDRLKRNDLIFNLHGEVKCLETSKESVKSIRQALLSTPEMEILALEALSRSSTLAIFLSFLDLW